MKHELKIKNKVFIFIITFVFILISSASFTYSEDNATNINEAESEDLKPEIIELSDEYKKWLELPDEEKENSIAPLPYNVSYKPVKSAFEYGVANAFLASSYNLNTKITMPVRNQMNTGCCWAFTACRVLETNISLRTGKQSDTYSPRHMEYSTSLTFTNGKNPDGYNREVGAGGNGYIAMSYYTRGFGPVLESDMPFQNSEAKIALSGIANKTVQKQVKEYRWFPNIVKERSGNTIVYKDLEGNTLSQTQVNAIRTQIKEHIINYGAVGMLFYADNKYFNGNSNSTRLATYTANEVTTNHAVSIVGWNDNYSKNNFANSTGILPVHDGAWICLNSWGESVHNKGYFYISYDDKFCEYSNYGIVSSGDIDYNNIYQYDILSANSAAVFQRATLVYGANVFSKKGAGKEYLSQIGITSIDDITVDVYVNPTGALSTSGATKVKSNVSIPAGYKAIELDNKIELSSSKFAVIIACKGNSTTGTIIPVEKAGGATTWDTAKANAGESYYSLDGISNWVDITTQSGFETANFAIKAFTINNTSDKEGPTVTFSPDGGTTPQTSYSVTVNVTDNVGLNTGSLKYVWTTSTSRPNDSDFSSVFTNGSKISSPSNVSGSYYLWVYAEDSSKNKTYAHSKVFNLKKASTDLNISFSKNGNSTYEKNVSTTVTVSGGTVKSIKYLWSIKDTDVTSSYITGGMPSSGTLTKATGSGQYYLWICAVSEDNKEFIKRSNVFYIDSVTPVAPKISAKTTSNQTVTNGQYVQSDVTVTLSTVTSVSGIKSYQYSINGGTWNTADSTRSFKLTSSGYYYIKARAINNVNTTGTESETYAVGINKEGVSIKLSPDGNSTYSKSVSTMVNVTTSGTITSLKYLWSREPYNVDKFNINMDVSNGGTISKSTGSGDWYLWVYAKDNTSAEKVLCSNVFKLDNDKPNAPTIVATVPNGQNAKEDVTVTVSGSSSTSGIRNYEYSTDNGGTWKTMDSTNTFKLTNSGLYNIRARAVNNVGTTGEQSSVYTVGVNKEGISVEFLPSGNTVYAKRASTKVTVTTRGDIRTLKYLWSTQPSGITKAHIGTNLSNGSTITKTDGSGDWYLWVYAEDDTGWDVIERSEAFRLDNDKPNAPDVSVKTVSGQKVSSGEYAKEDIIVTISGSDSMSGIKHYEYSVDNGRTWKTVDGSNTVTLTRSAFYNIKARAVNNVDTTGDESGLYAIGINKDGIGVTFEPNGNSSYVKKVSTRVTTTTSSTAKIIVLKYLWSQKNEGVTSSDFSTDLSNKSMITKTDGSGDWYLWIYAEDNTGWEIIERSDVFKLDNDIPAPPTIEQKPNDTREVMTLELSGPQSFSGIQKYQYTLDDGKTWKDVEISNSNVASIVFDEIGDYTVKVRAVNNLGTIGEIGESIIVKIRTKIPVIKFDPDGSNEEYKRLHKTKIDVSSSFDIDKQSLKYIWSKEETGITEDDFKGSDAKKYSNGQEIVKDSDSGEWYLWACAINSEGDTTIERSNAFYLDNDAPNVLFSPDGSEKYKKIQSTKVTVNDDSGVKELKYLWSSSDDVPDEKDFKQKFISDQKIQNSTDTGKYYLWVYAEDNEGNKIITRSEQFYLDNTAPKKPKISSSVKNGETTDKNITIRVEGGEAESEVEYEYSLDNGKTWKKVQNNEIKVEGTGTVNVLVVAIGETDLRSQPEKYTVTIKDNSQNKGGNGSSGGNGNSGGTRNTGSNGGSGSTQNSGSSGTSGRAGTPGATSQSGSQMSTKYSGDIPYTGLDFDEVFSILDVASIVVVVAIIGIFGVTVFMIEKKRSK